MLCMALHIGFARCSFRLLSLSCSEFIQKCIIHGTFTIDSRKIETKRM